MPVPPYRRPFAGEPLAGASARRVLRDVENLSDVSGTGDLSVSEGGGQRQILDGRPKTIPARIVAAVSGNAYSFVRVDDGQNDGTFPDMEGTTEEGDGEALVAWELNGRDDVPPDTIVQLSPCLLAPGYTFEFASPGGCCGFYADYYTTQTVNAGSGGTGTAGTTDSFPFASSTIAGVCRGTMMVVPANSGPQVLKGGLFGTWEQSGTLVTGTARYVQVNAHIAQVDSSGAYIGQLSVWRKVLFGQINTSATQAGFPVNWFGDLTFPVPIGVGGNARFTGYAPIEIPLQDWPTDRYFAWYVQGGMGGFSVADGWSGAFNANSVGRGGTFLYAEPACCIGRAVGPPVFEPILPPRGMDSYAPGVMSIVAQLVQRQGNANGTGRGNTKLEPGVG